MSHSLRLILKSLQCTYAITLIADTDKIILMKIAVAGPGLKDERDFGFGCFLVSTRVKEAMDSLPCLLEDYLLLLPGQKDG